MEPVNKPTRDENGPNEGRSPNTRTSDSNTQGDFGFDASAWDPLWVLAAQIDARFQRRVRRRVEEVLGLLQQVAGEDDPSFGSQDLQALAFCLAEVLTAGAGVSPGARPRLLQRVACHAFQAAQEPWAGEPAYWSYLNLMLKRFRQSQAEEGLEPAVRGALHGCSSLLRSNPQVARELAAELLVMLDAAGRDPIWRGMSAMTEGHSGGATDKVLSAPPGRPLNRAHLRPLAARPTSSCAPPPAAGMSET